MKTISFYSYKGGVGRTLLLCHVARYLRCLGKRVLILDFDFYAPGVTYHFGISPFMNVSSGFIDILNKYWENNGDVKKLISTAIIDEEQMTNLHLPSDDQNGWIKIIPTGNASEDSYWSSFQRLEWVKRFDFTPKGHMQELRMNFFLELKQSISDLGADYFLIDAKAGMNRYANVANLLLADHLVYVFTNNRENVKAMEHVFSQFKNIINNWVKTKTNPIKMTPVISRIPKEFDNEGTKVAEAKSEVQALLKENDFFEATPMQSVHADFHLNLDEDIRLPNHDLPTKTVRFYEEVLKVLAILCPELSSQRISDAPPKDHVTAQAHKLWKQIYGIDFEITQVVRPFYLNPGEGVMENPADEARNVSLRVDTLVNLLVNFYKGYKDRSEKISRIQPEELFSDILFESGRDCGTAFGTNLAKQRFRGRNLSDPEKIEDWCNFDSDVGFGGMKLTGENQILINNLFLVDPDIKDSEKLIHFARGYITGVLSQILDSTVDVQILKGKKSGESVFQFSKV